MKIIFCLLSSFLFIFTLLASNNSTDIFEDNEDLNWDFYSKAMFKPRQPKSQTVILFTNARNENNIKEWAAHHLLIGFDLVHIFDHKSDIPLSDEFNNFDPRVTIERCEWENPVKMPLMNRAVSIARNLKADWMLYLDADEFLILNDFTDIKKLLNAFPHADSLGINWLLFGSNYHVEEPEGLILDNYTRSDLFLDQHVKSFARTAQITEAVNPHYYCIKNPLKMYSINNQIINITPYFNHWNAPYFSSPAYIAHYQFQSEETYLKRKVDLPRDDCGEFRGKIPNIHQYNNAVENLIPKEKYASQVKLFLDRYSSVY